jgi:hypothetical protein
MSCPLHDAAHLCEACPERYDTDGRGFVHRLELKGRVPLRRCSGCREWKAPGEWSTVGLASSTNGEWFKCAACAKGKA